MHLATAAVRAKEVPRRYWWRIEPIRARHSTYLTGQIAVRVSGIEPLPDDLVMSAHTVVCQDSAAIEEVKQARRDDLTRQLWLMPSAEEFEDEWRVNSTCPLRAPLTGAQRGLTGNSGSDAP